jgi:maltose/moltooligosaccharide transporter
MGVYMGVFNLFIVIPQIAQSLIAPQIYKSVLGDNPLNAVLLGGISLLIAAASVLLVRDVGANRIGESEFAGGAGH